MCYDLWMSPKKADSNMGGWAKVDEVLIAHYKCVIVIGTEYMGNGVFLSHPTSG